MLQWGIVLVPEKEDIDMSHYPKEFVEFGCTTNFPIEEKNKQLIEI